MARAPRSRRQGLVAAVTRTGARPVLISDAASAYRTADKRWTELFGGTVPKRPADLAEQPVGWMSRRLPPSRQPMRRAIPLLGGRRELHLVMRGNFLAVSQIGKALNISHPA
jgi:hypothetical protein